MNAATPLVTPWIPAIVLVIALAVLAYLVFLLVRSGRASAFEDADAPPPEAEPEPAAGGRGQTAVRLGGSFRRAMTLLDRYASGPDRRYRLPWYLFVGEEGSRDELMLGRSGLPLPFGPPEDTGLPHAGRADWWLFDQGVVLELGGSFVGAPEGDDGRWRSALRWLQRVRPLRPVDGILLAVSARDLAAARAGTYRETALAERAATVYRRLWKAQRRLGLRLPVYVVVTGCQSVPGFLDLGKAVPERARGEMVGWSNPYAIETEYQAGWVGEAFGEVCRRLAQVRIEVLTEGSGEVDADQLFLLPETLSTLERPLRGYLEQIFRRSSYHEAMPLRGIYFTATAPTGEALFLRDLLARKVFSESALAAPTGEGLMARDRRVRFVQAAVVAGALILGAGVWSAHHRLQHGAEVLEPILGEVADHVEQARREKSAGRLERAQAAVWAGHLLGGMSAIDVDRFGSIFLPSSWLSPFADRLEQALVESFDEVLFEAMYLELGYRAEELTEWGLSARWRTGAGDRGSPLTSSVIGLPPAVSDAEVADAPAEIAALLAPLTAVAVEDVDETAEFEALAEYVDDLAALERAAEGYNRLPGSRDIAELARVAEYLFGITVPAEFYEHADLYREAQRRTQARRFELAPYRDGAVDHVERLADNLELRLFEANPLRGALDEAAAALDGVSDLLAAGAEESVRLDLVDAELGRLERLLTEPGLQWVFLGQFDPGPSWSALLADIADAELLGAEVAARLRRSTESEWIALRRGLALTASTLTGPLLAVDRGMPRMELSPETLVLRTSLERFTGQQFAARAEERGLVVRPPAGTRIAWDVDALRRAAALWEPYESYRASGLARFPETVQPAIDAVARDRLASNILDLTARAQRFVPAPDAGPPALLESRLRDEIAAFDAAAGPLLEVLGLLERLGRWEARREIEGLLVVQGGRLLTLVDRLLEAEAPYRPPGGNFAWWDGSAPPALAAFERQSPEELGAYLARERQRLTLLSERYAAPLLTWLNQAGLDGDPALRRLVGKWEGIVTALHEQKGEKPGNSVSRLEEFIVTRLATVRLDDCFTALPAAGATPDWFAANHEALRREVLARCYELAEQRAVVRYGELARFFNQRLAGRFPFAAEPAAAFSGEATAPDLEAFLRLYDANAGIFRALARRDAPVTPEGISRPALDFLDQIADVRAFFAPFLDAEDPPKVPLFDVEPQFRVNRGEERGGHQIIDWSLGIGARQVSFRDADRRLRWAPGEPLRLTLRWAADAPRSPQTPVPEAHRRWASVDGRTLTYEFTDRWALLAALAALRARPEDVEAFSQLAPYTLRLAAITQGEGSSLPDPVPAQVFVRLVLLAPDGTQPLVLPRFPEHAPESGGDLL